MPTFTVIHTIAHLFKTRESEVLIKILNNKLISAHFFWDIVTQNEITYPVIESIFL